MKTKEEFKKDLQLLIESIQDEHTLNILNDDIVPYIIESRIGEQDKEEDILTEKQLKKLDNAIQQGDEGKVINVEEFKMQMATWHIK